MRVAASRRALAGVALLGGLAWTQAVSAMTLTEALQASGHDPTRAIYEAQYAADREAGTIERAQVRPNLSVQGDAYYAHTRSAGVFGKAEDDYPTWSASVQLSQPLFRLDWFDIGRRARALEDQAELSRRSSELDLQLRVAQRYFNVLIAQDQLALAEAEAKSVTQAYENTSQRYAVELVPGTDLKEAQARRDLAEAALVSARRNLDNARDELDETTGRGDAPLPVLPAETRFPALVPTQAEDWVQAARANSPRIALAREAAVVARTRYTSARASALPTLDLVGSAGRDDNSHFDFGSRVDDSRIGVQLNIPLYAGGATLAALRQAEAQQQVAEADLQRVERETERQTRQQFRTVESAYSEVKAYERSLASAQVAELATRNGYDAGTRTITDVLDAQSRVVQARRDFNNARYGLLLNLLQLKQIVGRLAPADFADVDRLLVQPSAQ